MKICPECYNGRKGCHELTSRFCYGCGAELVEEPKTRCSCGTDLKGEGVKFCPDCGKPRQESTLADFRENNGHENDHFLEGEAREAETFDERNQEERNGAL